MKNILMYRYIALIIIFTGLGNELYSQVEIPDCLCNCKQIKTNNFTNCVDSISYKSVWIANKIFKTDLENRLFIPPDKDFFPGITNLQNDIWPVLENQTKFWALEFDSVFVVTGTIIITNKQTNQLDEFFYKAILKGCQGDALGFLIGNDQFYSKLVDYAVSIDSLENVTNYNFFPLLSTDLQSIIESGFNLDFWPVSVQ